MKTKYILLTLVILFSYSIMASEGYTVFKPGETIEIGTNFKVDFIPQKNADYCRANLTLFDNNTLLVNYFNLTDSDNSGYYNVSINPSTIYNSEGLYKITYWCKKDTRESGDTRFFQIGNLSEDYYADLRDNQTYWLPRINITFSEICESYPTSELCLLLKEINRTTFNISQTTTNIFNNQTFMQAFLNSQNITAIEKLNAIQSFLNSYNITIDTFLRETNLTYLEFFNNLQNNNTYWLPVISNNQTYWLPKINLTLYDLENNLTNIYNWTNYYIRDGFNIKITDFGEVVVGNTYKVEIRIDQFGIPKDADSTPKVSLLDNNNNYIVTNTDMVWKEPGRYSYDYNVSSTASDGVYTTIVNATVNNYRTSVMEYWEVETNVPRVEIHARDKILPGVSCIMEIENEGTTAQEYQYAAWLTNHSTGQFNDNSMIDGISAAKKIEPGEAYSVEVAFDATTTGTHYCKAKVLYGSEKSYASDMFIITTEARGGGAIPGVIKEEIDKAKVFIEEKIGIPLIIFYSIIFLILIVMTWKPHDLKSRRKSIYFTVLLLIFIFYNALSPILLGLGGLILKDNPLLAFILIIVVLISIYNLYTRTDKSFRKNKSSYILLIVSLITILKQSLFLWIIEKVSWVGWKIYPEADANLFIGIILIVAMSLIVYYLIIKKGYRRILK